MISTLAAALNRNSACMERLEKKVDRMLEILEQDDVAGNCKKMGAHIDFVEKVYDNVKNPLGYLCHKITHLSGGGDHQQQYSLTTTTVEPTEAEHRLQSDSS